MDENTRAKRMQEISELYNWEVTPLVEHDRFYYLSINVSNTQESECYIIYDITESQIKFDEGNWAFLIGVECKYKKHHYMAAGIVIKERCEEAIEEFYDRFKYGKRTFIVDFFNDDFYILNYEPKHNTFLRSYFLEEVFDV